jgi:hypothetical protein
MTNQMVSNLMCIAQAVMIAATVVWLPLRLPSGARHPRARFATYGAATLAAWTLLCIAWLDLNYVMMIDIPGGGPMFFCLFMWSLGAVVYGIRMRVVARKKAKTQNQALHGTADSRADASASVP